MTGPLPLGAFLKLASIAATGGHAKLLIQDGEVSVNGQTEIRRSHLVQDGDVVAVHGVQYRVCTSPD